MAGCGQHDTYCPGCRNCQKVNAAYARRRHRGLADGTWLRSVPVDEIRPVIERLLRQDMTMEGIARAADLSTMTIKRVMWGTSKRVLGDTAARIRDVVPAPTPPLGLVDVTAPRRMTRALGVIGYSVTWQSRRCGVHAATLRRVRGDKRDQSAVQRWVSEDIAAAIERMYDRAAMESDEQNRASATWARKRGWHGPLAWDDDTIRDPRAKPYDEARPRRTDVLDSVVQDALVGKVAYDQLTTAERVIVVSRLAAQGWVAERIGEHLTWGDTGYHRRVNVGKFMERHGITSPEAARLAEITYMQQVAGYTAGAA